MLSRDSGSHRPRPPATLGGAFTPNELERLVALRRDYDGHAEHSELMIDPLWLEFTRWLYEQGRISEDLPESDMPALADWSAPD